jgi:hypothetical protein
MKAPKNIIAAVFFLSLIMGSASAQNPQTGSDHSHAALTIRVYIAPVIVSPVPHPENAHAASISYDIPTAPARLSVTEKTQEETVKTASGELQQQAVKIITMVPE